MTGVAVERAALHPMPRWGAAFREQLAVTGMAMWPLGVALVIATALLMNQPISLARALLDEPSAFFGGAVIGTEYARTTVFPSGLALLLAFAALFVPRAAWRGGEPSRRTYHAAMPLPLASHALLKVACGWIWVMLGVAFVQVAIYVTLQVVESMLRGMPDATIAYPGAEGGAWRWAVPFVATTVGYVIGSAVALATSRPALVVVGALAGLSLVNWAVGAVFEPRTSPASVIAASRFGVAAAINGTRPEQREVRFPMDEETRAALGRHGMDRTMRTAVEVPDLGRWVVAAGTWLALGMAALTYAARRPRD